MKFGVDWPSGFRDNVHVHVHSPGAGGSKLYFINAFIQSVQVFPIK